MNMLMYSVLAQLDASKVDTSAPALTVESSAASTWILAAVLAIGILLITFKTSKRNAVETTG